MFIKDDKKHQKELEQMGFILFMIVYGRKPGFKESIAQIKSILLKKSA